MLDTNGGSRQGPYVVAAVSSVKSYVLSLTNGDEVEDGKSFEEDRLEAA